MDEAEALGPGTCGAEVVAPDVLAWAVDPAFTSPPPLETPIREVTAHALAIGLARPSSLWDVAGPCDPSFQGGPGDPAYQGDCWTAGGSEPVFPPTCPDAVVHLEGGGCDHLGGASPWWLGVLLWLARRRGLAALVVVLLAWSGRAAAADVGLSPSLDAGRFHLLDATPDHVPWTLHLRAGLDWRARTVRVVQPDGTAAWVVRGLGSGRLAVGLDVFRYVRVTLGLPVHGVLPGPGAAGLPDALQPRVFAPGDLSLQLSGAILRRAGSALQVIGRLDLPTSREAPWVSGRSLAVSLVYGQRAGPVDLTAELGVLTARPDAPTALTWGAGASWRHRRFDLGVEAAGQAAFGATREVAERAVAGPWSPVELGGGLGVRAADGVWLRAWGGAGLNRSVGVPRWTAALTLHVTGHEPADLDQDGLVNLRDRCPRRAEDPDRHADADGCPDPDNDADGLQDDVDACPDVPEDLDGDADEDGCPDRRVRLVVEVVPEAPERVEAIVVGVDGAPRARLVDEREATIEITPGHRRVDVQVTGHAPWSTLVDAPEAEDGDVVVRVRATPELVRFGTLRLALEARDGSPLAGWVRVDGGAAVDVAAAGWSGTVPAGRLRLDAGAPGHAARTVVVRVEPDGSTDATVVLEPAAAWLDEHRLRTAQVVRFDLDSAALVDEAGPTLDALAALLRARPDVVLVRVEGHADSLGSSAYNYALSVARAEAVVAALVARGVEAERLVAVGSGEALRASGEPARSVEFLILVWDDARGALTP